MPDTIPDVATATSRQWIALGAGGIAQAVLFAARPMTTYRMLELGANDITVGAVAALFGLAPLGLAIPVGRAIDDGHALRLLRVGSLVTAAATIGLIAGTSVWHLAIANLVLGGGIVTTAVSAQGSLARFVGHEQLDGVFARFTIAASIGQVIGPIAASAVAGAEGSASDARSGLLIAFVFAALGVVLTALGRFPQDGTERPTRDDRSARTTPVRSLVRSPGILGPILASLALLAALDVFTAFLPLVADRHQIAVSAVGTLLAGRGIASIGSRLFLPSLTRRLGRARILRLGMLASAGLLLLVPFAASVPALAVVTILFGLSLGLGQPLTMSLVAAAVSIPLRATVLSVRMTCNRIGQLTVPFGAGALSTLFGLPAAFALAGALLGVASTGIRSTADERGDQ